MHSSYLKNIHVLILISPVEIENPQSLPAWLSLRTHTHKHIYTHTHKHTCVCLCEWICNSRGIYIWSVILLWSVPFYSLSSSSQFLTLVFQSHVCLSISNARPFGHLTPASLVLPFSAALSHLQYHSDISA